MMTAKRRVLNLSIILALSQIAFDLINQNFNHRKEFPFWHRVKITRQSSITKQILAKAPSIIKPF